MKYISFEEYDQLTEEEQNLIDIQVVYVAMNGYYYKELFKEEER